MLVLLLAGCGTAGDSVATAKACNAALDAALAAIGPGERLPVVEMRPDPADAMTDATVLRRGLPYDAAASGLTLQLDGGDGNSLVRFLDVPDSFQPGDRVRMGRRNGWTLVESAAATLAVFDWKVDGALPELPGLPALALLPTCPGISDCDEPGDLLALEARSGGRSIVLRPGESGSVGGVRLRVVTATSDCWGEVTARIEALLPGGSPGAELPLCAAFTTELPSYPFRPGFGNVAFVLSPPGNPGTLYRIELLGGVYTSFYWPGSSLEIPSGTEVELIRLGAMQVLRTDDRVATILLYEGSGGLVDVNTFARGTAEGTTGENGFLLEWPKMGWQLRCGTSAGCALGWDYELVVGEGAAPLVLAPGSDGAWEGFDVALGAASYFPGARICDRWDDEAWVWLGVAQPL